MTTNIFDVGLILSIEAYFKTHQSARVLGWQEEEFLLTSAIYIQGQPSMLKSKDPVKARFLKDGIAYGFESEIIAVQFYPFPLMFMKYPAKLETLKLRVATRFKADLPAKLLDASGALIADAVLIDISEGGCGLKAPVQEGKELTPDAAYAISFTIMDKELSLGCAVRKLDKGQDTYFLGMEFTNVSPQHKETLTLFLDFLKKYAAS